MQSRTELRKLPAASGVVAVLLWALGAACARAPSPESQAAEVSASRTYWVSAPLIVWRAAGEPASLERKFSGRCRVTPQLNGEPVPWLNADPGSSGTSAWWESGPGQPISVLTGELRYLGDCLEAAGFQRNPQAPPSADARFTTSGEKDQGSFSLHVELEATEQLVGGTTSQYLAAQADFASAQFPAFDDPESPGRMNTVEVQCSSPTGKGSLILILRLWQTSSR